MSKFGIISAIVAVTIAGLAISAYQDRTKLRVENQALRQELTSLPQVIADNHRLSNIVAQAKDALANADDRFQELLKLRAELSRLNQENSQSNRVEQSMIAQSATEQLREMAALRTEVAGLGKEISKLRDEIRQVPTPAATAAPAESSPPDTTTAEPRRGEDRALAVRIISTQGESFAEKLKRSVAAQEGETFQEVFGRYLQVNGIDLSTVAAVWYNDRTGRVIVRAAPSSLDQIEKLTLSLDRAE